MINWEIPWTLIRYSVLASCTVLEMRLTYTSFHNSRQKTLHYHNLYLFFSEKLAPRSLSLTIWLVKWIVASKVKAAMVHRDPVNITASLICNGRHFVRLTVRWGVTDRVLCARVCVYTCGSGDCVQMSASQDHSQDSALQMLISQRAHQPTVCVDTQ